jgi:hypothetical protein
MGTQTVGMSPVPVPWFANHPDQISLFYVSAAVAGVPEFEPAPAPDGLPLFGQPGLNTNNFRE